MPSYKKYVDLATQVLEQSAKKTVYQQKLEYSDLLKKMPQDSEGNVVYKDPDMFYHCYGHVRDSFTGEEITRLSSYQRLFWYACLLYNNIVTVKTNKGGLSTVSGMVLAQHCMMRKGAGHEKLIIAQKAEIARDHLDHLKSELIQSPVFYDMVDVKRSKATELVIKNPYDPWNHSKIKAIGNSSGGVVSWRNVDYVWISDLAASEKNYDNVLNGAFTRLALTRGKMIIETIPGRLKGKIYEIWKTAEKGGNNFIWIKIPCYASVEEGVMSWDHIKEQKRNLGSDFPLFYEAEFMSGGGNVISRESLQKALANAEFLKKQRIAYKYLSEPMQREFDKSMGVDVGLGKSNTGITILVNRGMYIECVYSQEIDTRDIDKVYREINFLIHKHRITKVYLDAQFEPLVYKLKAQIPERMNKKNEARIRSIELRDLGMKSPFKINGIAFKRYHMDMIYHIQKLFSEGVFAIDEDEFPELVKELGNAAIINEAYGPKLDKKTNGTKDVFDSFRLAAINHGFD